MAATKDRLTLRPSPPPPAEPGLEGPMTGLQLGVMLWAACFLFGVASWVWFDTPVMGRIDSDRYYWAGALGTVLLGSVLLYMFYDRVVFNWRVASAVGAIVAGGIFLYFDSPVLVDEGAKALRYSDMAGRGWPFRYSPDEPARWGLPGLVHYLVLTALSLPGLVRPLTLLLTLSYLETAFMVTLLIRFLWGTGLGRRWLIVGLWVTLVLATEAQVASRQGLGLPLHLALILGLLMTFLEQGGTGWARPTANATYATVDADTLALQARQRLRGLLVMSALTILSGFGGAPVAVIILLAATIRQLTGREGWRPSGPVFWQSVGLYLVLPLALGLMAVFIFFGDWLPLSARLTSAPDGYPEGLGDGHGVGFYLAHWPWKLLATIGGAAAAIGYLIVLRQAGVPKGRAITIVAGALMPALTAGIYLIGYVLAPPQASMVWYEALPEALLALSWTMLVGGWASGLDAPGRRIGWIGHHLARLAPSALLYTCLVLGGDHQRKVFGSFLAERMSVEWHLRQAGFYLGRHGHEGERVLTAQGYPMLKSGGMAVVDGSGRHQPLAAELGFDLCRILDSTRPEWIADYGHFSRPQDFVIRPTGPSSEETSCPVGRLATEYVTDTVVFMPLRPDRLLPYFVHRRVGDGTVSSPRARIPTQSRLIDPGADGAHLTLPDRPPTTSSRGRRRVRVAVALEPRGTRARQFQRLTIYALDGEGRRLHQTPVPLTRLRYALKADWQALDLILPAATRQLVAYFEPATPTSAEEVPHFSPALVEDF